MTDSTIISKIWNFAYLLSAEGKATIRPKRKMLSTKRIGNLSATAWQGINRKNENS
jgi:hypothetical protein